MPLKRYICFALTLTWLITSAESLTLEDAQRLAQANFPLVKRYDLITQTTSYTLDNLSKGWYPQVGIGAQVTYQTRTTQYNQEMADKIIDPSTLKVSGQITTGQGQVVKIAEGSDFSEVNIELGEPDIKGIGHTQYRVGAEVNQLIWEGGAIKGQKEVARLQSEVQKSQVDVNLYSLRERVCDLYFGMLLIDEQMRLCDEMINLLDDNQRKVETLNRGGIATGGDVASIKAEKMKTKQQRTQLENSRRSFEHVLNVFIGKEPNTHLDLIKPAEELPSITVNRPELRLFDKQLALTNAQDNLLKSALMPKVIAFAHGFYGYIGYDMMHDMLHHSPAFNALVGVKVNWTIGSFYTYKNDRSRLAMQRAEIETQRETFLFNNKLQSSKEIEDMAGYRRLMADDDEIIDLRVTVRKAAESKLNHGIIDVNNLLQEITKENNARIAKCQHELEMLQHLYKLKIIQNS